MGEDDSTARFCPVPQAMSMSALSVVPIDCVQYGLQEIPGHKGSFIADDIDGFFWMATIGGIRAARMMVRE